MQVFTVLHGSRFVRSFGHTGGKSALDIPRLYSQVAKEEEEEEGERIARVLALVVLPWVFVLFYSQMCQTKCFDNIHFDKYLISIIFVK